MRIIAWTCAVEVGNTTLVARPGISEAIAFVGWVRLSVIIPRPRVARNSSIIPAIPFDLTCLEMIQARYPSATRDFLNSPQQEFDVFFCSQWPHDAMRKTFPASGPNPQEVQFPPSSILRTFASSSLAAQRLCSSPNTLALCNVHTQPKASLPRSNISWRAMSLPTLLRLLLQSPVALRRKA